MLCFQQLCLLLHNQLNQLQNEKAPFNRRRTSRIPAQRSS